MAEEEAKREDGIQFVVITTPNVSTMKSPNALWSTALHVMCDKPLAFNLEQAQELEKIAKEKDCCFG